MDFVFDPSLVLYLPLWKLDGASIMSQDAYGHTCTVTGALWRPNGTYFDGSDDNIATSAVGLPTGAGDRTLEVWFKGPSLAGITNDTIIGWGSSVAQQASTLSIGTVGDSKPMFWGYNSDLTFGTALTDDTWYHLVATVAGGTAVIGYNNGNTDGSSTITALNTPASTTFYVADFTGATFGNCTCTIGEVRIYSRALTPQEIQHNYLATKWRYR